MEEDRGRMFHNSSAGMFDDQEPVFLFVGALVCLRHGPFRDIGNRMREGRAALLLPSAGDFSSGRYLDQIVDAIAELSLERNTRRFVIAFGCQWVILSTDTRLIRDRLREEYNIEVEFMDSSHLELRRKHDMRGEHL